MRRNATALLLLLAAVLLAPRSAFGAQLDLALCAPDRHSFITTIDSDYFPLPVGQVWVYTGTEDGQDVGLRIEVRSATETFRFGGGRRVKTRVVQEVEWLDTGGIGTLDLGDQLVEVSLNYFAQTEAGTVCYFGENVDIYEDGEVVSHEGAWRADGRGLPGIAPGIFMPARPRPGMSFQQEVAPGVAEDQATITRAGTSTLPDGTDVETITVRDYNPLDGSSGTKVYADHVGLIEDGPLRLISASTPRDDRPAG